MRYFHLLLIASVLLLASCAREQTSRRFSHEECNGIYYWKTTIDIDDSLINILNDHDIKHLYIRMFDVVANEVPGEDTVVPNASLQFRRSEKYIYGNWTDSLNVKALFTPTVFITVDALSCMQGRQKEWAEKIVTRSLNMCTFNDIQNIEGLQLDCDWTASSESSFFSLCDTVRQVLKQKLPGAKLSSTIRLHQLGSKAPPVDYGVLMLYNTGAFNDPDTRNSIIDKATIEPYLKHLSAYPLHLDIAYPTYSWYLLFRHRQFMGLIREVNLADSATFTRVEEDIYKVKNPILNGNIRLEKGDIIRRECSRFDEVSAVKAMIEKRLKGKPHSNILYHLDYNNLSKYSNYEIDSLYSVAH